MDKNKSLYKLKNLPHVYYINLDDHTERKEYMEDQFKYWELENYTRISAYDGRNDDLSHILSGVYPPLMNSGEVGCVTSHLKAIKYWLDTSDSNCAIFMEDDCDLSVAKYWPFTWKDFFCQIPYDYDVIQLAIINPASITIKLHKRFVNDFSTACYLINRRYAKKLVDLHIINEKYKLDNGVKPRAVADDLIYNSGNTFSIPLFLYRLELGSSIHDEHIEVFHKSSHDALISFWQNDASNVSDWNSLFDYDPYYGTLPPNVKIS
jgi:hypothetical protein